MSKALEFEKTRILLANPSHKELSRISEFGFEKDREFAARTCSLATEGTQEFPPLKKCDVQVLKKMFKGHYTLQL